MTAFDPVTPTFDEIDAALLADRQITFDKVTGPRVGDFVEFSDGITRRISYLWMDSDRMAPARGDERVQTSDGGSWHLADGFCDFSGSLFVPIPLSTLEDTGQTREGDVWFFHHNWWKAHNGVHCTATFRVYRTDVPAPRS